VPEEFVTMMRDPDPKKSKSVMEAMVQMVKLDVAKLKRAFEA
jgi:predicted 3-demethylubiquinone-9 3-methyltransferase (glyoxalase superfamily)